MFHRLHHPSLLLLLTGPPLAPSIALPIALWSISCIIRRSFYSSLIHRSHNLSLLLLLAGPPLALFLLFFDPSLASSVALSIALWSTARTVHRFSYWSLIHRLHHPSLLLAEPPLAPSIASPIALLSIVCIIGHSFYSSLINRSHHPSLFLADPPMAPAITPSSWSTARTIHRFSYCSLIHRLHHPSLFL